MMELVFATNNPSKLAEIKNLLGDSFILKSLADLGFNDEIPETNPTIEENASAKALFIYIRYAADCFADDTGLEVKALNNRPGVYSARFAETEGKRLASPGDIADANIAKLLYLMQNKKNREARFRTVISLVMGGREYQFEGVINGEIAFERRGEAGFGYDPVFIPEGQCRTFAEMNIDEKNLISHRARAFGKLVDFLSGHG